MLVDRLTRAGDGAGSDSDDHGVISDCIVQAYRRFHEEGPVFLHHLASVLRNPGTIAGHDPSPEQRQRMERLANRLYQWCDRGRYAQLFDRPTNVAVQGPVTYIDLGQVAAHPDLMPVVVLILSDLIYREAMRAPGRERTLVIQDELWSVLADPAAAKLLDDMYRRFPPHC